MRTPSITEIPEWVRTAPIKGQHTTSHYLHKAVKLNTIIPSKVKYCELDGIRRVPSTGMPPPAVTLTFNLLIRKFNQHVSSPNTVNLPIGVFEPKYVCDQNWVKFSSLAFEIWCSQGFRVIACCDLDLLT